MAATGVDTSGLLFLSLDEARGLDAIVSRIVPGDAADPGAREAGATAYIDRALAGPYAEWQLAYRDGLGAARRFARERHGKPLHELGEAELDDLAGALEAGTVPGLPGGGPGAFFAMVWAHTVEGMFCDPAYGGNRDGAGWKLIGFPGTQFGYAAEEMRYGADLTTKPLLTLADIRRLAEAHPERFFHRSGPRPAPAAAEIPALPDAEASLEASRNQGG